MPEYSFTFQPASFSSYPRKLTQTVDYIAANGILDATVDIDLYVKSSNLPSSNDLQKIWVKIPNLGHATLLVGVPFSKTITGFRDVVSFSASGLPPGIVLSASGVFSGTPTVSGFYESTITLNKINQPPGFQKFLFLVSSSAGTVTPSPEIFTSNGTLYVSEFYNTTNTSAPLFEGNDMWVHGYFDGSTSRLYKFLNYSPSGTINNPINEALSVTVSVLDPLGGSNPSSRPIYAATKIAKDSSNSLFILGEIDAYYQLYYQGVGNPPPDPIVYSPKNIKQGRILKRSSNGTYTVLAGSDFAPSLQSGAYRYGTPGNPYPEVYIGGSGLFGYSLLSIGAYKNATGTAARLNGVNLSLEGTSFLNATKTVVNDGLVCDSSNNLFFIDKIYHTIRKCTPAGVVTTFAGRPRKSSYTNNSTYLFSQGSYVFNQGRDGSGIPGSASLVYGFCLDASGNIIFGDNAKVPSGGASTGHYGATLRQLTSTTLSTLAGAWGGPNVIGGNASQYDATTDGTGTSARMKSCLHPVRDSNGDFYFCDESNLRKCTSTNVVSTVSSTVLYFKISQAIDSSNNIYCLGSNSLGVGDTILKTTPAGVVTTLLSLSPTVLGMCYCSFDNSLYFNEGGSGTLAVKKYNLSTSTLSTFYTFPSGSGHNFQFKNSITSDSSGNIYIVSGGEQTSVKIYKITQSGVVTEEVPPVNLKLNLKDRTTVSGLVSPNTSGNGIYEYVGNENGFPSYKGTGEFSSNSAWTIVNDSGWKLKNGNTIVFSAASSPQPWTVSWSPNATVTDSRFNLGRAIVYGIARKSNGNFILLVNNMYFVEVTTSGNVSWIGGVPFIRSDTSSFAEFLDVTIYNGIFPADGSAVGPIFIGPLGDMTIDNSNNLYVTDTGDHTVRKITPAGVVTTLAGLNGVSGYVDGTGSQARFKSPKGITFDPAGYLLVGDSGNNYIRKVTLGGVVTTAAGNGSGAFGGLPPGIGTNVLFAGGSDVMSSKSSGKSFSLRYSGTGASPNSKLLLLDGAPSGPTFTSPSYASWYLNAPNSFTVTVSESVTNFSATSLPTGLSINSSTGVISGTPTVSGVFSVTVTCNHPLGTLSKGLIVEVKSSEFAFASGPPSFRKNHQSVWKDFSSFKRGDIILVSSSEAIVFPWGESNVLYDLSYWGEGTFQVPALPTPPTNFKYKYYIGSNISQQTPPAIIP